MGAEYLASGKRCKPISFFLSGIPTILEVFHEASQSSPFWFRFCNRHFMIIWLPIGLVISNQIYTMMVS